MKFNFYEENKLRDAIENNHTDNLTISSAIWYAAVYYTHLNHIDNKKELFNKIVEFVRRNYSDFKYEGYVSYINTKINNAKGHNITNIARICITASEMNKIQNLNDQRMEKLAFIVLALAKYENARSDSSRDTFYAKVPEIFRLARLAIPKNERNKYLHAAYQAGVISMNFSIGYDAITVGFVSHCDDDPVVMELDEYDYMELVYAYLNYKNGGYKRCKECNRLFKAKGNNQYCQSCTKKNNMPKDRFIKCIDCGEIIEIKARDGQTCRCRECQSKVDVHNKSVRNQRYYKSHKN